MRITEAMLRDKGACRSELLRYLKIFGSDVRVTKKFCIKLAAEKFDVDWLARNLLTKSQLAAYKRDTAAAWAAYLRDIEPAEAAYKRETTPALAAYERDIDSAEADYKRETTPILADYLRDIDSALAAYLRDIEPARADYLRDKATAWAVRRRAEALAFWAASRVK